MNILVYLEKSNFILFLDRREERKKERKKEEKRKEGKKKEEERYKAEHNKTNTRKRKTWRCRGTDECDFYSQ